MEEAKSILEESRKSKITGFFSGRWSLKKIVIILVVLMVVGGAVWFFGIRPDSDLQVAEAKQEIWTVARGDVRVAIESDGKVVADDMVALSYPVTGVTLRNVFVKQGDQIKKGDLIASMDTESNQFDLRSAQNAYESAVNNLALKLEPPTDQEIASAKSSIEQAEISLEQTKISAEQSKLTIEQSVANAERSVETAKLNLSLNKDAETSTIVQNAYESLFNTLQSISITISDAIAKSDEILGVDNEARASAYKSYIGILDSGSYENAKVSYRLAKSQKGLLDAALIGLTADSSHEEIESAADTARSALEALKANYLDLQRVLDYSMTGTDFTQSQLDSMKSSVLSMRSSLTNHLASISSGEQSIVSAQNNLSNYEINYEKAVEDLDIAKKKAEQDLATLETNIRAREIALEQAQLSYDTLMEPPKEIDLVSSRISVDNAKISLDKVLYNIDQATLTSPIDGEVVSLNGKEGDLISKDESGAFVQILNKDTLFIEVYIEEADINKISVGQKAYVTFDAIEDATVEGEVSFVSVISEQNANGITSYLVRVLLDQEDAEGIREGMTAFVEFAVAESADVLVAPVSAVKNVSGKPSVQMESGEWVPVVTGFTDGKTVEIISGVNEGDRILVTSSVTSVSSSSAGSGSGGGNATFIRL